MKHTPLAINELDTIFKILDTHIDVQVVILEGDLASGKTTFVNEYVKYKGCNDDVSSPTFSIQNCYCNSIFHYDIYNHGLEHFLSLGMLEEFEKEGIHFVEWGDDVLVSLLDTIGVETLVVKIDKNRKNQHCYEVIGA